MKYNSKLLPLARELRKNCTSQERHLWYDFLANCEYKFVRQKAVKNYILDFYCAQTQLAIELDGGGHYEDDGKANDIERTNYLNSIDIEVVRYCNLDIDNNFESVCMDIIQRCKMKS